MTRSIQCYPPIPNRLGGVFHSVFRSFIYVLNSQLFFYLSDHLFLHFCTNLQFLGVDYRNQATWLKYAEMEMKNKFINHARNVWDRTVTIHPRVDVYW